MFYIAHRGLFEGPDPSKENHPDQIQEALHLGFHCEVDVRYITGKWMLGHDEPQYEVPLTFLQNPLLWVHCKNVLALEHCPNINKFWHDTDDYTLTHSGYIWAYPGKALTSKSICVMPEWKLPPGDIPEGNYAGVCSDYILEISKSGNGDRSLIYST